MFAGRARPKKTGLNNPEPATPRQEPNFLRGQSTDTPDDTSSLPQIAVDAMSIVRLSWDFMASAEFNPIPYSLSLLDGSSLGSDYDSFCGTHDTVEKAMDVVVNGNRRNLRLEYHLAFNTVIQRFSSVVDTISESQKRVKEIKNHLEESKETLECKRFDFLHIWLKSLQFKEMSRILEMIVDLQNTEVKIEQLLAEKHYLHAVRVLVASEKIINSHDLSSVEALSTMRLHFGKIKDQLQETLLNELSDHLYLKTKASMNRLGKEVPAPTSLRNDITEGSPTSDILRFNQSLADQVDADVTGDAIDSYSHIQVLLEGLFHLGRLPNSLNYIKDRVSIEMYHVVDRVLTEVERQNPETDEIGIESHIVFKSFLTELFNNLQSVLDGHIFCLDISHILLEISPEDESGFTSPVKSYGSEVSLATNAFEIYSKREVATAIQNEIKALLYDYLTASEQTSGGMPVLAIAEMLKDNRKGVKRQLNQIYKLKTKPEESVKKMFMGVCEGVVEEAEVNVIESGHKQLVASTPSNILVAYKPTLNFMTALEKKLGMRLANFQMFLEDFYFNSYLPMIQEEILVYFHANVNGIDAFQEEVYGDVEYPLIKSALCMVLQIHGISRLIKSVPVHSSELLKFMEFTLKKFYEKCVGRFRALIADDKEEVEEEAKNSSVISIVWASDAEIVNLFSKNTYLGSKKIDLEGNRILASRETLIELKKKGERSFHRSELLLDPRRIQQLASLLYGMQWVLDQIAHLRTQEKTGLGLDYSGEIRQIRNKIQKTFSTISEESIFDIKFDHEAQVDLVLDKAMEESFDHITTNFSQLIQHVLYTIRIEIRCHTIFYLDLAIREGNYNSDEEHPEPDPYIGLLNTDLTMMEEMISESLPPRLSRFLFDGLTQLMSAVLISNTKTLKAVNACGIERLLSNVLSLQQNLISFTSIHENELDKCKKFFLLFNKSADDIVDFASTHPGLFTFDEYKSVVDLVFQEKADEGKDLMWRLKEYFIQNRN